MLNHMPITEKQLDAWSMEYRSSRERQLSTMALSRSDIQDVAYVCAGEDRMRHKFSLEIPTLPVTNQKHSGRCWLFAATNVLRERIARAHHLERFELFHQSFVNCSVLVCSSCE